MHIWQTLKFFISSTFIDMEQERDALAANFQKLRDIAFERCLHLIPYDLRWRDCERENIVDWCLEMVERSHYFVGILGYRYGWRPPYAAKGKKNENNISVTEMEIALALQLIPKERRFFCFADYSQYSPDLLNAEPEKDRAAMENLRRRLQDSGEKICIYQNQQQVAQMIYQNLREMLDRDYPPGTKAQMEQYSVEDALREILEQKKKGFVGRQNYLQILQDFCREEQNQNYLAIHAVAGAGKSSLLAHFIDFRRREYPDIPVIVHYMSTPGTMKNVHALIGNIAGQLVQAGIISEKLETNPDQLLGQVQENLHQCRRPLILAIDGLDEMDEEGKTMSWLPLSLPSSIKVILTTRPVEPWPRLQENSNLQSLALPPLGREEMLEIIGNYKQEQNIILHVDEEKELIERSDGNPLFLKVALDEISAGGFDAGQMAQTIEELFHRALARLKKQYGNTVIDDYLGLIAAARSGLVEVELAEILAKDHSRNSGDEFVVEIHKALANFIVEQKKMLQFFHPEFERSVKMMLGKAGMRRYHNRLSQYFGNKGYRYQRALLELPYQRQWAEQYGQLLALFGDISFWENKNAAGMLVDLREDIDRALNSRIVPIPEQEMMEIAPEIIVQRTTLSLLARILDLEFDFLEKHKESLTQSFWNRGFWHDHPQVKQHMEGDCFYENIGLHKLVDYWRRQKEKKGNWCRLQTLRPFPEYLDSSLTRILRHRQAVTGLAVSGNSIISVSWDNIVRIWDMESGRCIKFLEGHEDYLTSVAVFEEKDLIATAAADKTIRLWCLKTGQCLKVLSGHRKMVTNVCFDKINQKIISCSKDKTIKIWEIAEGKCIKTLEGHRKTIACLAVDSTNIYSGSWDKTIKVWDFEGHCLKTIEGHEGEINDIAVYDQMLFSASKDRTIKIWNLTSDQCLKTLDHDSTVFSFALTKDRKVIISGTYGGVWAWEIESGKRLFKLDGHESVVFDVAISEDKDKILSCSSDKTIRVWNMGKKQISRFLKSHEKLITGAWASDDGRSTITASRDCTMRKWDTTRSEIVQEYRHQDQIRCLAISPRQNQAVTGSQDCRATLWLLSSDSPQGLLEGHEKPVICAGWSSNGKFIITGSRDNTARIWDLENKQCISVLRGHEKDVRAVYLNHDATLAATGAEDKKAYLWQVATGKQIQNFTGHEQGIVSVAFDQDKLISSSRDNTTRIWKLSDGQCSKVLTGCGQAFQLLQNELYALTEENETIIYRNHAPISFLPTPLKEPSINQENILCGYAGVHFYTMKLVEDR